MHYWNKFYEILNCIWYIRRCLKLDCFTSTKRPPDFARLINNFIIIYHNYSGMTVKAVYIPIIIPNNRIPFSPIMFLQLCTPGTVYKLLNFRLKCLHLPFISVTQYSHDFSTLLLTHVLFTITFLCHTAHLRSNFPPYIPTYGILNRHDPL